MFFKKSDSKEIYAPVSGTAIPLMKVTDSTFNSGLLGPGIGFDCENNDIYSPIDGEITMVFPTKHAIGLKRKDGLEILLHIGIETVTLNGKGFQLHCKTGDVVKSSDLLISFDKDYIIQEQLDPTLIMIFPNAQNFEIQIIRENGGVNVEDVIVHAEKKS